jgi:hypothetical protein
MKRTEAKLQSAGAPDFFSATVHLVVRVPRISRVNRITVDTVRAHNETLVALGRVAIAKFGNPGTRARCDRLRAQIDSGLETLLILVTKRGEQFLGYKSRLTSVHYGKADNVILAGAPKYYSDLGKDAKLWFTVIAPFETINLEQFSLASNRRPLLEVMRECRTASLLVEKG